MCKAARAIEWAAAKEGTEGVMAVEKKIWLPPVMRFRELRYGMFATEVDTITSPQ